jgi:16S rRNA (guanine966-N2)-methyltransferase
MRVIAGTAGGIRLAVPKRRVRPTMDRVKGAIFSSLGDAIIGSRVLDLFAGSGALGIEALSRGADSAVFVEVDRQTAEIIDQNLANTKLEGRIRNQDVFDFLRHASKADTFKIIFADPPYEKTEHGEGYTEQLLNDESLPHLLESGGIFVLEKRPNEAVSGLKLWRVIRQKHYGSTEVLFLMQSAIGSRGEGSPRQQAKPRGAAASERGKRASFNRQPAMA